MEATMDHLTQSEGTFVQPESRESYTVRPESKPAGKPGPTDIFAYSDYRMFLVDRFAELQSRDPAFSQRRLAKNSGILNPGFFNEVIKGRRNLTPSSTLKFSVGLRLTEEEAEFFVTMVKHADSPDPTLKQIAGNRLRKLRISRLGRNAQGGAEPESSKSILTELSQSWTPLSAHFEILSENSADVAPVFFNDGKKALRSCLDLLTDVREVATEQWEQNSNIRDRVFQLVLLVKPTIREQAQ